MQPTCRVLSEAPSIWVATAKLPLKMFLYASPLEAFTFRPTIPNVCGLVASVLKVFSVSKKPELVSKNAPHELKELIPAGILMCIQKVEQQLQLK